MLQQTSLTAFKSVDLEGRRLQVYEVFRQCGAFTNAEVGKFLGLPINCVTGRTRELVKRGIVEEKMKDICSVTGNTAIRWGIV